MASPTFSLTVGEDEWTPTLRLLKGKGEPAAMRARMVETAQKIVAFIKVSMTDQKGFADGISYRKLKIRWRYHGHKELLATPKNLRRAARGATVKDGTLFGRGPVLRTGSTIEVIDKTPVTASSKALIDLGDLRRSWGILEVTASHADVGNRTALEKLKAAYNDDRGHWWWGRVSAEKAMRAWLKDFDKGIFGSSGGEP